MEFTIEEQAELRRLRERYKNLETFMQKYKKLSYIQLDYSFVHDISLFTVNPELNFEELENNIQAILKVLPAIKQIFAKPFIHLKDENVVLPTEAVRVINNKTIQHISSHSELWTDLKENEIEPAKLLTRVYEDDYGIYENLVFCQTIDDILAYARSNLRMLKELIYTNQTIQINLLERVNHLNYFLALGKLHTGYSRNFDTYYGKSMQSLNKLQFIMNSIVPRLKRPVYKKNKHRPKISRIHKTNILAMHRDYHQIYKLAKYFSTKHISVCDDFTTNDYKELQKNYFYFCQLLCIFAIGHFNFVCDEEEVISFSRFEMNFVFKEWKLKLKTLKNKANPEIIITIQKDKDYKIRLIPTLNKELQVDLENADECHICFPYEEMKEGVMIGIDSIESFRRIEQIVLRAMVYTDEKKEECPFCSHKLTLVNDPVLSDYELYECTSCRTEIGIANCPTTKRTYQFTRIAQLAKSQFIGEEWLLKRKYEAQMYFRNITPITTDLEIVCPCCNQIHK
ncbi:MAG: hypothetical protein K2N64_00825 [Anaeroplasmataceae bacterium]|nr:hypothetical protein [Anaeroplasmataceae bacterium]